MTWLLVVECRDGTHYTYGAYADTLKGAAISLSYDSREGDDNVTLYQPDGETTKIPSDDIVAIRLEREQ
jgi:hypothetical protein